MEEKIPDWKFEERYKAKLWARQQYLRKFYLEYYKQNPDKLEKDTGCKGIELFMSEQFKPRKFKIYMITVNPEENTNFEEFKKKVEKSTKKRYIDKYIYTYEWREKRMGLHAHIRILCKENILLSRIRKEFYNTFKNMIGNPQHINIKYGIRNDSFLDYVKGIKNGEEKKNTKYDMIMRNELNLKRVYSN